MHAHLYHTVFMPGGWAGENAVRADTVAPFWGVTTMVDAGSSGRHNWDHFKTTVVNNSKTRILAFLNICGYGMLHESIEQEKDELNSREAALCTENNRDSIVGFKTAHYRGRDWHSVDRTLEAGNLTRLPAMIDFGYFRKERPIWVLLNEKMRKGDILTHCYRGTVPWFNKEGKLYDYLKKARSKGILFDLGHGGGSFLFRNAIPAVRSGHYPDTISTDTHMVSLLGSMQSLPACMNRFLAMGMPLGKIFQAVTTKPASAIGRPELIDISPGRCPDVAVWSLRKGQFGYADAIGGRIEGEEALECEMTIRNGTILFDKNARAADPKLNDKEMTGIRTGKEWLLDPENP